MYTNPKKTNKTVGAENPTFSMSKDFHQKSNYTSLNIDLARQTCYISWSYYEKYNKSQPTDNQIINLYQSIMKQINKLQLS
eukprot:Pgem_evm1s5233